MNRVGNGARITLPSEHRCVARTLTIVKTGSKGLCDAAHQEKTVSLWGLTIDILDTYAILCLPLLKLTLGRTRVLGACLV